MNTSNCFKMGNPRGHCTHTHEGLHHPSKLPASNYLYKEHSECVGVIYPEHLQLRLVVATVALHLSSPGQGDLSLLCDQLGTHTPRAPSARRALARTGKGCARPNSSLQVWALQCPRAPGSRNMRVDSYVHTPPRGEQRGGLLLKQAGRAEGVASRNPHAAFGNSLRGVWGEEAGD